MGKAEITFLTGSSMNASLLPWFDDCWNGVLSTHRCNPIHQMGLARIRILLFCRCYFATGLF
jgi:hypothetical protein